MSASTDASLWNQSLAKMNKQYDRIKALMALSPNSKEIKRALHHISTESLLRELQRRNAMPPIPKKDDEDIDHTQLIGWLGDDTLAEECERRDISVTNPEAVRLIMRGIDQRDWGEVEEGYAKL